MCTKQFFFSVWLWALAFNLPAAEQLSPRIANYTMDVVLDIQEKKLYGKTQLTWRNPGTSPVGELRFHLYYNAFKNSESTFMQGSEIYPDFFSQSLFRDCGWGWSEVLEISDHHGNDLSGSMDYIQPDDNNPMDETVLRVALPDSVAPGDSIIVDFDWHAKIPKAVVRTGYNQDFYFFAQWFPKLGVYEPAGMRFATEDQWNCHQYHAIGEYYADFGVYEVSLTVPKDFVVGASGALIEKNEAGSSVTWTFLAEDMIDFTWTASPSFIVQKETWKNVELSLLTYPEHAHFAPRYFDAAKNALSYMDRHLGSYPYSTLTMVDPPIHGIFTGAMEYPTLITSLSFCFLPSDLKTVETLVVHEFLHQYFMQMVATNEQEEPWLDEGLTTYYEGRIMDHFYGKKTSLANLPFLQVGSSDYNRWEYFNSPDRSIADQERPARSYTEGGFGEIVYNKTAIWLKTLEGLIGRKTFDQAMRSYFETWKFGHPCRDDFMAVFNNTVKKDHGDAFGTSLDWFFEQVIFTTRECDYAVAQISNRPARPLTGYLDSTMDCREMTGIKASTETFLSSVQVQRPGDLVLPVEIHVFFSDGTRRIETWDGKERSRSFQYESPARITSVEIDPERRIWIDRNFLNNGMSAEKRSAPVSKLWLKALERVQQFMTTITGIL